jgi:tRNA threonylcarbamoyladenosine biosynthesis protein TsaE
VKKEYSLNEIESIARQILKEAGHSKCLAFFADMGAGKTTVINAICKELGVVDNVSSPTYSIINEYRTKESKLIVHMDWYRLKDEGEALNAGVEDYMYNAYLCLIEWPERAEGLLPENFIKVELKTLGKDQREIIVSK